MKAYLAGPDVFLPNASEYGLALKIACAAFGVEGLFPLDNKLTRNEGESLAAFAGRIRVANMKLIQEADIVLANITPFRGPNADDGTAFEIGYVIALGKKVYCYSRDHDETYQERMIRLDMHGCSPYLDQEGMEIENFGLTANLMLVDGSVFGSIYEALEYTTRKIVV